MKKYLNEIKEEAALCRKYIDECDIFAPKSEHEKLALKIASDCEQTLGALTNEIEKDGWISVDEAMPEERDSIVDTFKKLISDTSRPVKKQSRVVLVVIVNNYNKNNFIVGTGKTINGEWETVPLTLQGRAHVAYWMPFPKFDPKEARGEQE